jgi:hypothetical protein
MATITKTMQKSYHGQLTMTCDHHHHDDNDDNTTTTTTTPQLILESIEVAQNSTVTGRPPTYELQPYLKCDAVLAASSTSTSTTSSSTVPPPRTAACTAIRGDWPRDITFEWIEYHRLIVGIDHFFIYINEGWNNTKFLPNRSYITYIPYDFHLDNHKNHVKTTVTNTNTTTTKTTDISNTTTTKTRKKKRKTNENELHIKWYNFFQQAHMNDCVYMTRRMAIDWVAMIDVDEYIFVEPTTNSNSTTLQTALLDDYQEQHSSIGALQLNSFSFGDGPTITTSTNQNKTTHPLVMDYVYRQQLQIQSKARFRVKNIINPQTVDYINVHYIVEGKQVIGVNASTVRIQHYKHPWLGPHRSGPPAKWIQDTVLRDRYRETVAKVALTSTTTT